MKKNLNTQTSFSNFPDLCKTQSYLLTFIFLFQRRLNCENCKVYDATMCCLKDETQFCFVYSNMVNYLKQHACKRMGEIVNKRYIHIFTMCDTYISQTKGTGIVLFIKILTKGIYLPLSRVHVPQNRLLLILR